VPNVSEGRDRTALEAIERSFAPARFLDLHTDPDHNRAVFTLAARQGELAQGLLNGARVVVERFDLARYEGLHPHVGALDVLPVVYRSEDARGAACAEAITAAALIGDELEVPVILYGELATRPEHRERAWLRAGGWRRLAERIEAGEVIPDFGPRRAHPRAGTVLAAARPPLVAFNVELRSGDVELARAIAAELRESGGGFPGVRPSASAGASTAAHRPARSNAPAGPVALAPARRRRRSPASAGQSASTAPRSGAARSTARRSRPPSSACS
jgi:glutamate formiminotransferase/glutamate formiminotransferase/formiminotetrahydrofolate cyclodeaminase